MSARRHRGVLAVLLLVAATTAGCSGDSPEDALSALRAPDQPQVVLIDVDLPGMNGIDLLSRLQEEYPSLNCTLMSANDHALARYGYRAVPFFPKPLDVRRLLKFLRTAPAAPAA